MSGPGVWSPRDDVGSHVRVEVPGGGVQDAVIRFVGRRHESDECVIGVELTGDGAAAGEHNGMVVVNPLMFHRCVRS